MKTFTLVSLSKRLIAVASVSLLLFCSILVFGNSPITNNEHEYNLNHPINLQEDVTIPSGSIIIDMGVVPQTI